MVKKTNKHFFPELNAIVYFVFVFLILAYQPSLTNRVGVHWMHVACTPHFTDVKCFQILKSSEFPLGFALASYTKTCSGPTGLGV